MRYLARTGTDALPATAAARDPWNAWVFSLSSSGSSNREENYSSLYVNGRVAVNRVTEEWKTALSIGENYNESRFSFGGDKSLFIQRSYSASALQVKSLGDHWSAGVTGRFNSSTYLNQRAASRVTPTVEYDLFPYANATRRLSDLGAAS